MKSLVKVLNLDSIHQTNFVTVDVGYNTGVVHTVDGHIVTDLLVKELKCHKDLDLASRLLAMGDSFKLALLKCFQNCDATPKVILIEGVQIYASSESSMASASSGDLVGLSYLVGIYVSIARKDFNIPTRIVLPRQWKGSMGKDIVKNRIKRATGLNYPEHVADAVGMSLSFRGIL